MSSTFSFFSTETWFSLQPLNQGCLFSRDLFLIGLSSGINICFHHHIFPLIPSQMFISISLALKSAIWLYFHAPPPTHFMSPPLNFTIFFFLIYSFKSLAPDFSSSPPCCLWFSPSILQYPKVNPSGGWLYLSWSASTLILSSFHVSSPMPWTYISCAVLSSYSYVWFFVTPWTVAHQAPLSIWFSREEYWSGLPCPPPGNLPDPGINSKSLMSPALPGRFFTSGTWQVHKFCRPL